MPSTMININKKLISASILILTLILMLSTIGYAKPFTDAFRGGLIQINDFFVNELYKAYATAIDFFFFALLFISIYMMGVRYAFKEVKKPEKVIAILLGLMTAFLLVLGGFSATILLPYIHWLLYLLLFILYWWLLKGIKNKFWRFILALLLTIATIALVQGLFDGFTAPDAEGFFSSLSKSFAGIRFPETPGVPDYFQNLFGAPVAAPTGPDLTTLPPTTTPTAEAPGKGGIFGTGFSWWWLTPLLLLFLLSGRIRGLFGGLFRRGERPATTRELTIEQEIDDIIGKKRESITKINTTRDEKNRIIQAVDKRQAFLNKLAQEDVALIFTDPAKQQINQEGGAFKELLDTEVKLITELKELKDTELKLYNKLEEWKIKLSSQGIEITHEAKFLKDLIGRKTTVMDIRNMGIVWLIVICYDFEKRELVLNKELQELLEDIEELVKGKFTEVKAKNDKLGSYIGYETGIIKLLNQKIEEQIRTLEELKKNIRAVPTPMQPSLESPYDEPVYSDVEEEKIKLEKLKEEVGVSEIPAEARKKIEEEISQDIYELLKTEEISVSPDADKIVDEAENISKVSKFKELWKSLAEYIRKTRNVKVGVSNFTRVILTNIRERRRRIEEFVNRIKSNIKKTRVPVREPRSESITDLLGIDEKELEAQRRIRFRGR